MARNTFLLGCVFVLSGFTANAQPFYRCNTFSYGVNQGLLQTTIGDIEIDSNNFCWISFPNGIQKFDGQNFTDIPIQPGLPDDKHAEFFRTGNGDLLICHSLGISKYLIRANKFSLVYQQRNYNKPPVIIGEDSGVLYSYDESGTITAFDNRDFHVLSVFNLGLANSLPDAAPAPLFSSNSINGKVAVRFGSVLFLVDLRNKNILGKAEMEAFANAFSLKLRSENEVVYYDSKDENALHSWNFETKENLSWSIQGKENNSLGRCVIFPWQQKTLISFNNRLFEIDRSLLKLKSEIVNFQNQPVAGNASIHQVKEDNFGNLYVQTVTGGIRKIIKNNYPIKYFGSIDPNSNNILAVLPDKTKNRILTGGTGGLFVFDTLQQLVRHIQTVPGLKGKIIPNGILRSLDGDYFIFVVGSNKAWRLSRDLSSLTPLSISSALPTDKSYAQYFGNLVSNNGTEAIFQTQNRLYRIDFGAGKINEYEFSDAYALAGLSYKSWIISHARDELIFLDRQTFNVLKKIPFSEPAGVRCIAEDLEGNLFAGGNKGIIKIDTSGRVLQQWNKTTGMPDECVYAITFDKEGAMWCSTNKGICRIDKDNNILQITKRDGLQENEFNTNVVAVANDGEVFWGGINGVSSFYPRAIRTFSDNLVLHITRLRINNENYFGDTAIWTMSRVELPYNKNLIAFDLVAMGSGNPDNYVYQYRMKGLEKEWAHTTSLESIRYLLQPGSYTFQIYASRQFNPAAQPLKEFVIIIDAPFWNTWWFRGLLVLVTITGLWYIISSRNKRRYTKKLQLLQQEQKLEQEKERISKDLHDSLGAYANAVLYKTEMLELESDAAKRDELIKDLKFASKDIITSLRETVWALKKEKYTSEECLLRIQNFIQPLMRYYNHINFRVVGDAPNGLSFHYTKALNIVRIVQEAVANSIKHSQTESISIASDLNADNRWKIAIADTGHGFVYHPDMETTNSNGLTNMKQRAATSGFLFTLETDIDKGTIITIII